jgi:signal transduction histidine kinase
MDAGMATRSAARAPRSAGASARRAGLAEPDPARPELYEALLDAPADPLVILDAGRRVVAANRAFRDIERALMPALIRNLGTRPRMNGKAQVFDLAGKFPTLGHRVLSITAARLDSARGLISLSIADVTETRERERALRSGQAALEKRLTAAESLLRESEARLRRNSSDLRAVAARLMTTQEEERRRVSRELHDDFNQKLAMLEVDAERLCQILPANSEIRFRAQSLKSRASDLSNDVRRVAYQLHPSILDHLGLAAALRAYCREFSEREGIEVKLSARRAPERLPEPIALCFYRIAQESLRNVAKHARATAAAVKLDSSTRGLHLTVRDNGVGFDPKSASQKGGIGLLSIRERARLVDGQLTIQSKPAAGTRIDLWAPLTHRNRRVNPGS